ncbi:MAG: hypothetical protein OXC66_03530 [Roseovarius sp.]|nr:hypothetical protein [Roseovarius sp.]
MDNGKMQYRVFSRFGEFVRMGRFLGVRRAWAMAGRSLFEAFLSQSFLDDRSSFRIDSGASGSTFRSAWTIAAPSIWRQYVFAPSRWFPAQRFWRKLPVNSEM